MLDLLSSLVGQVIGTEQNSGQVGRAIGCLESTRQYARETADRNAGEYEAVAHAHATTFLALTEEEIERIVENDTGMARLARQMRRAGVGELPRGAAMGVWGTGQRAARAAAGGDVALECGVRLGAGGRMSLGAGRARKLIGTETPACVVAAPRFSRSTPSFSPLTQHKASYVGG